VVGSDDGHLRCFNADRAPRWDVAVGSATTRVGIRGTPALGRDGTVIVGSEDGGIHGVRSADGTTVFDVATGGPVRSPARIDADGWIFVGSEDDSVWGAAARRIGRVDRSVSATMSTAHPRSQWTDFLSSAATMEESTVSRLRRNRRLLHGDEGRAARVGVRDVAVEARDNDLDALLAVRSAASRN